MSRETTNRLSALLVLALAAYGGLGLKGQLHHSCPMPHCSSCPFMAAQGR